jgi:glycosyltransferase involved in cell wall biosynthesis
MRIVVFTHPSFLDSQSMPRFANMLIEGLKGRGYEVDTLTAKSVLYGMTNIQSLKKWFGYIDQYVIFPFQIRQYIKQATADTLFVFVDNALGPWVPYVAQRPHVIHCHDFMAQQSAKGEISENPTGITGRIYQKYIRWGYRKGKCFISVSKKTQEDLHSFLDTEPLFSNVIYNGLNRQINLFDRDAARLIVSQQIGRDLSSGFILHVGGNQWYKNRKGLIAAYTWCRQADVTKLPLVLVGATPNTELAHIITTSSFKSDIIIVDDGDNAFIDAAYCGASFLFFPSLNEGFGWPIAEAMYCGCPVLTTSTAPMTEVGSNAAFYVSRMPNEDGLKPQWYQEVSCAFEAILTMDVTSSSAIKTKSQQQVLQFDTEKSICALVTSYEAILSTFKNN